MSNPLNADDELRKLAERYAKDFGIRYDKIRINAKGSITYRQSGSNSGGWQESGDSINLPSWVITNHYDQLKKHELQAQLNYIEYLDQILSNESMDWKGLLADNKKSIEQELEKL